LISNTLKRSDFKQPLFFHVHLEMIIPEKNRRTSMTTRIMRLTKRMKDVFARQKEQAAANGIEIKDYMLQSKPEDMDRTIEYFHQKYSDAETYLLDFCRCSREDVEFIRHRLLDGNH
ncbi:MAG: tyrosine-protein phosphatase, partial [Lachnospiraceae bacterium]|nr:tyrosine-protein phosphatase [Lachnospiraceae bacterium]